jgi:DNA-directed RNA polymerase subunit RPC12/RpoP
MKNQNIDKQNQEQILPDETTVGYDGLARATYTLVETQVKCASCGNKWIIEKRIDDDFDEPIECPDCLFAASAWNFIPEWEGPRGQLGVFANWREK